MPTFDAAGVAELAKPLIRPFYVAWLDITGDEIYATTAPVSLQFSGTGDVDLDYATNGNNAFSAVDHTFIDVSEVVHKEGGSETVTVTLSGMLGIDSTLLNQIGTKSNWQGRTARLWLGFVTEHGAVVSSASYYTGYMMTPRISGSPEMQTIALEIEGYLASMSEASGRTYLDQDYYDSADTSAASTVSNANGTSAGAIAANGGGFSGNLPGGGVGRDFGRMNAY